MWFFSSCIGIEDFNIGGWFFKLPPGPNPPGPPPPFPSLPNIEINTPKPLPPWPPFTIGPDHSPTFPPKPSNGPDGGCKTTSGELCITSTSYGVSVGTTVTSTTTSRVLSTCATIYGCDVEDVASTTTTTSATTCTVSGDLSTTTGECDNGNFPLYDPFSDSINCDVSDEDIPRYLSGCQEDADNELDFSTEQILCQDNCPEDSNTKRSLGGEKLDLLLPTEIIDLVNVTKRQSRPAKRPRLCPPAPPPKIPGQVLPGRPGQCDVVFECDTDRWPNVCNNAASAQAADGRAKPTALTYMGPGARQDYVTDQWWRTHPNLGNSVEHVPAIVQQRDAGTLKNQPHGGWGLIGCQVEEYPFGNSISPVAKADRGIWDNRAVLRLVPGDENQDHGSTLSKFINAAIKGDPNRNLPPLAAAGGWTCCVDITGGGLDRQDYLLGADQSKNRCGQAFGPGYLLVNDVSKEEKLAHPMERQWDPWFDNKNQLFAHTIYSSGNVIATKDLPSQYGKRPAPGMQTFIRAAGNNPNQGTWSTVAANGVTVGTAVASGVPGKTGQNLKYDAPGVSHAGILRRSIDIEDLGYDPRTPGVTGAPTASHTGVKASVPTAHTNLQARRPMEQVLVKKSLVALKKNKAETAAMRPRLLSRAERFRQKRQSVASGSFLDVRVYQQAFLCQAPETDHCQVDICWEGGVVYNADGSAAAEGSADQSGPNGEDTGDDTSTTSSSSSTSVFSLTDLPTLTTSVSTPSGSTCASTVTQICAPPLGNPGASPVCVSTSSCASWVATDVPTTTSEPPPPTTTNEPPPPTTSDTPPATPTTPLQTSAAVCNNEADFPGHADVNGADQEDIGEEICNSWSRIEMDSTSSELHDRHARSGVNYDYYVSWVDGCVTTTSSQAVINPLGKDIHIYCYDIFESVYKQCNNGGVGGYMDVGCLRYRFDGAK